MQPEIWSMLMDAPGFAGARIPGDVFYFFDDFLTQLDFSETGDLAIWNVTLVGQAAHGITIPDGSDDTPALAGGMLQIVTEGTTDDGDNLQVNGQAFHFKSGYPIYFECRFLAKDVSATNLFIGLAIADTTILAGCDDKVGMTLLNSVYSANSELSGSEKSVTMDVTPADANWQTFAISYDGDNSVKFYMSTNGGPLICYVELHPETTAHYICDDMMLTPSIEFTTNAASIETLLVDYVFCAQKRYKA